MRGRERENQPTIWRDCVVWCLCGIWNIFIIHGLVTRVRSDGMVKLVLNVTTKNMSDFGYGTNNQPAPSLSFPRSGSAERISSSGGVNDTYSLNPTNIPHSPLISTPFLPSSTHRGPLSGDHDLSPPLPPLTTQDTAEYDSKYASADPISTDRRGFATAPASARAFPRSVSSSPRSGRRFISGAGAEERKEYWCSLCECVFVYVCELYFICTFVQSESTEIRNQTQQNWFLQRAEVGLVLAIFLTFTTTFLQKLSSKPATTHKQFSSSLCAPEWRGHYSSVMASKLYNKAIDWEEWLLCDFTYWWSLLWTHRTTNLFIGIVDDACKDLNADRSKTIWLSPDIRQSLGWTLLFVFWQLLFPHDWHHYRKRSDARLHILIVKERHIWDCDLKAWSELIFFRTSSSKVWSPVLVFTDKDPSRHQSNNLWSQFQSNLDLNSNPILISIPIQFWSNSFIIDDDHSLNKFHRFHPYYLLTGSSFSTFPPFPSTSSFLVFSSSLHSLSPLFDLFLHLINIQCLVSWMVCFSHWDDREMVWRLVECLLVLVECWIDTVISCLWVLSSHQWWIEWRCKYEFIEFFEWWRRSLECLCFASPLSNASITTIIHLHLFLISSPLKFIFILGYH